MHQQDVHYTTSNLEDWNWIIWNHDLKSFLDLLFWFQILFMDFVIYALTRNLKSFFHVISTQKHFSQLQIVLF